MTLEINLISLINYFTVLFHSEPSEQLWESSIIKLRQDHSTLLEGQYDGV